MKKEAMKLHTAPLDWKEVYYTNCPPGNRLGKWPRRWDLYPEQTLPAFPGSHRQQGFCGPGRTGQQAGPSRRG